MSKNISFILSLLISSPALIPVLTSEAEAQETVFSEDLQMLLPGQPAVADGKTEITYYFLFLDSQGAPIEGLSGKTSLGKLKGTITKEKNGVYSTTFTPEAVSPERNTGVNLRNASRKSVKKIFL